MEKETAIMALTFLTLVCALGWGFWEHWRTRKDQAEGVHTPMARHGGQPVGQPKPPEP